MNAKSNAVPKPSCIVCDSKYNKTTAAPVKCEYCEFIACRTCCQTYILSQPAPKCMNPDGNCGREWTTHFMRRNLTYKFMGEKWREHKMEIMYDTEKSMLPDTQGLIELRNEYGALLETSRAMRREINALERKFANHARYINAMNERIAHRERTGIDRPELSDPNRRNNWEIEEKTSAPEEPKYMRPCPADSCRGFLNRAWACGICSTKVCSHCHEIIVQELTQEDELDVETQEHKKSHICKPENIESAKEVMSHSKPCPKCNVFIFKIDGCNQMFCTNCHTAFDWRTRTIVKGAIHNPHYFAWLAENGRDANINNPIPQQCGGDPAYFGRRLRDITDNRQQEMDRSSSFPYHSIMILIRNLNHLGDEVIRKYTTDRRISEELRVRFLEKNISEQDFKREVYIIRLKEMRHSELRQLYEMVHMSVTDIFQRMLNHLENASHEYNRAEDVMRFIHEIYGVIDYANANLAEIPITYGTTTKQYLKYDLSCGSCHKSASPALSEKIMD